jgi:lipoate-protein ligase A
MQTMKDTTSPYPRSSWRLITSPPATGVWNMAVDSAILQAVIQGQSPPTLRLYSWSPPCLSLGYNQPISDVDLERLQAKGWDLVRRPTGGRAILHTDELTYAVIGPKSDPRLDGGVLTSYQRLAQALAAALLSLDLPVRTLTEKGEDFDPRQPICFEFPSDFEITAGGKKIIGSAQARKQTGVLQHGSLPLWGDLSRITRVLHFQSTAERSAAAAALLNRAATVETVLGREISWENAAAAFQRAFSDVLNLDLQEAPLSQGEIDRARELVHSRYDDREWTFRI